MNNSTLFNETNIFEDDVLEDVEPKAVEEIIRICINISYTYSGVPGNGLVSCILCKKEKILLKPLNVFAILAVLFVSESIYIFFLLTFEFNHQIIGDIFCKTFLFYFITVHAIIDWTISAASIIFLFRQQITVRHNLTIIAVFSFFAMVLGVIIARTTVMKTYGGRNHCVPNDYLVFHWLRWFGAYVSVIVMIEVLILKFLQKYWEKLEIFTDKVNRLSLVLFIFHWLSNESEFNFKYGDYEVIYFIFLFFQC